MARDNGEVEYVHQPVMVEEILEAFNLRPGQVVVDGTLGLGGHSIRFVERIAPGGTLIGFDWDSNMFEIGKQRLASQGAISQHLFNEPFTQIGPRLTELGIQADAILLDLGFNSAQIEDGGRGMSFLLDGPLDMRMDRRNGETAAGLLARLSPNQIEDILWNYGDERWARAIAKKIVEVRSKQPVRTTNQLVDIVLSVIPVRARDKRIHAATRTFQALRIAVNDELNVLEETLKNSIKVLKPLGVFAILSYHSGEDRIVKQFFRDITSGDDAKFEDLFRKPLVPTDGEVKANIRSRSAKLRAVRKRAE